MRWRTLRTRGPSAAAAQSLRQRRRGAVVENVWHEAGLSRRSRRALPPLAPKVGFDVLVRDTKDAAHARSGQLTAREQPIDRFATDAELFGHLARTEEPHRPSRKEPQPFLPFLPFFPE